MKAAEIRSRMDAYLDRLGFARSARVWQRGRLVLIIDGNGHQFKLPSGMSAKSLTFEMGYIACLRDVYDISPPKARKANGHDAAIPAISAGQ